MYIHFPIPCGGTTPPTRGVKEGSYAEQLGVQAQPWDGQVDVLPYVISCSIHM